MPINIDFKQEALPIYVQALESRLFSIHNPPVSENWILEKINDDGSITKMGCPGEMTVVFGHKKSRKSTLLSCLFNSLFDDVKPDYTLNFKMNLSPDKGVICVDSEMPISSWDRRVRKTHRMVGYSYTKQENGGVDLVQSDIPNSLFWYQKGFSADVKLRQLEWVIDHWEGDVGAIFVDQLGDYVRDINDRTEAQELISGLEEITERTQLHLFGAIHATRGTSYMTGVLGSEFEKKVNNGIYCEKDPLTKHTRVQHILSREGDFNDFYFAHDSMGYPILIENENEFI